MLRVSEVFSFAFLFFLSAATFEPGVMLRNAGSKSEIHNTSEKTPYVVVLGIAQDGGVPQAGDKNHPGWQDESLKRRVTCLAIVDPETSRRWIIDCTPDFKEQLHMLDNIAPVAEAPGLDGIFLTHAHMGHYTGLVHLGHEAMGAKGVPVYVMPRMRDFLARNGPWSQLVRYNNIDLKIIEDGVRIILDSNLSIVPFLVPHRQEYSEVIGYRITGPNNSVLFIPDIESWHEWEEKDKSIEKLVLEVDVAYLDGTFYSGGEIPGRDMSTFPHPFITRTMRRLESLPRAERQKIRFIHMNHTNPAILPGSEARRSIEENGFRVAEEMEHVYL